MEDCLSRDLSDLSYHADPDIKDKFGQALEVVRWLKQWDLMEYRPVLEEAGCSSHLLTLCDLQSDRALQVAWVGGWVCGDGRVGGH